jgi:folate-binding protein YgfZ
MGAEATEDTIPAELGQWVIDASVSFTKGCYTGQELVARIDSRGGNVPRHLRGLVGDGLAVGAPVLVGDKEVGTITSAAGDVALALLHRSVEVPSRVVVGATEADAVPLPIA